MKVRVILDESMLGHIAGEGPAWKFYALQSDGTQDFITRRRGAGDLLVAVTPEQFRRWKKLTIVSEGVEE